MPSSRWLLIPGLVFVLAGCNDEPTESAPPPADPNAVSTEAHPIPGKLPDMYKPEPGRFQVQPYKDTVKGKAEPQAESTNDGAKADGGSKAAGSKSDADKKPADSKPDVDKKPADSKADPEKKPADSKPDADKKPADSNDDANKKSADAAKDESPRELMSKAREALEKDEVPKAISLYEKVVAQDPKHHEALWMLAAVNQREGSQLERPKSSPYLLKSAEWIRKLRAVSPKLNENEQRALSIFLYNEACTYAVQGEKQKAIKSLDEATEAGEVPIDQLKNDEELDSIRQMPEYATLLKKLEGKAAELARKKADAAREHAKVLLAENKPFKFSFSLPNLDGKKVSLADFKGKVVIVDIWGTWCPPCRAEIPHFVDLYKKYREKGLEIVGINYENLPDDEAKKTIKEFVEKNKLPYTCVIGDEATQGLIPNFEGYPTTLFVDRAGKVRAKTVGFEESMAVELETIVTTLLDEQAPKTP